jgi:hypothetical protein
VVEEGAMLHFGIYLGTYIGTYLRYSLDPNFNFQPTVLARSHLITLRSQKGIPLDHGLGLSS